MNRLMYCEIADFIGLVVLDLGISFEPVLRGMQTVDVELSGGTQAQRDALMPVVEHRKREIIAYISQNAPSALPSAESAVKYAGNLLSKSEDSR